MLNLDATDKLSGIASSADKIEYTFSGVDGSDIVSKEGKLGTEETLIHECASALRLYSVTYVNTHDGPVQCHLHKNPGGIGTIYHLLPDSFILGPGNLMLFDGSRCQIINPAGELLCGFPSPLYVPAGGTGLSTFAQGDMLYAPAANILAGLTKGAANSKLFMNAAATVPEWGKGCGIITATRNMEAASGNQVFTGLDFKPSCAILFAGQHAGPVWSFGMVTAVNKRSMLGWTESGAVVSFTNYFCYIAKTTGSYFCNLLSFNVNGLTVAWTRDSNPTGTLTIGLLCFR